MATVITIINEGGPFDIEPDAATTRTPTLTATPTQWPIEDGASVVDHSILRPLSLILDVEFSPNPLTALFPAPGPTRPNRARAILLDALRNRNEIEIVTPDVIYERMLLTSISSPEDGDSGSTLKIALKLQQVQRVSSRNSAIPASVIAARLKHASGRVDVGQVPAATATAIKVAATVMTISLPGGALSAPTVEAVSTLLKTKAGSVVAGG